MLLQVKPNPIKNKLIRPEEGAALLFMVILAFIALQFLVGVIGMLGWRGEGNSAPNMFFTIATFVLHLVFIGLFFMLIVRRKKALRYCILNNELAKKPKGKLWLAIIIVLSIIIAAIAYTAFHMPQVWFITALRNAGLYSPAIDLNNTANAVLFGIVVMILAPISEELIFRGALLSGLSRITKPYKAVLLTALAFMLFHMSPMQTVYQFILGVILGFSVIFTGKLLVAIVIHAASNIIAFVLVMVEAHSPAISYYNTAFGYGYTNIINFLFGGVGVLVSIGIIIVGAAAIFGILFLFKKYIPQLPEPPPLDEPVLVPKQALDMLNMLGLGDNPEELMPPMSLNPFANDRVDGKIDMPIDPFSMQKPQAPDPFDTSLDPFGGANTVTANASDPFEQNTQSAFCTDTGAPMVNSSQEPQTPEQAMQQMQQNLQALQDSISDDDLIENPRLTKLKSEMSKKATWRFFWISLGISGAMWLMGFLTSVAGCY